MSNRDDLTIGCDPEFVLTNEHGNQVNSYNVIKDEYEDSSSCDRYIGTDAGGICEIRPMYSSDPLQVVRNIKKCMDTAVAINPKLLNYAWRAGSAFRDVTLGGHIHFGRELDISKISKFMAPPILALEDRREGAARRQNSDYGGLSDWRETDWGNGLEWRTPSSWLTSPQVAAGVLCLAKVIGQAIANRHSFNARALPMLDEEDVERFRLTKIRNFAKEGEPIIKSLPLYEKYSRHIDFIYNLIHAGKSWFPIGKDMRAAWKVRAAKIMPKFAFQA